MKKDSIQDEWDEKYESLVDAVAIDGVDFLELSAAGQIFHETFRERFRTDKDRVLPPPATRQLDPVIHDHAVNNLLRQDLTRFMRALSKAVPSVIRCVTTYCNPDLPEPTRFRIRGDDIEGVYSDGKRTVKFLVDSTAVTIGQRAAVAAVLNEWLGGQ